MKNLIWQSMLLIAHALTYALLGPDGAVWVFETVRTFATRRRWLG